jgi:hypothetical protein
MQHIEFYEFMEKAKNSERLKDYLNKIENLFSPREKIMYGLNFCISDKLWNKS